MSPDLGELLHPGLEVAGAGLQKVGVLEPKGCLGRQCRDAALEGLELLVQRLKVAEPPVLRVSEGGRRGASA